MHIAQFQWRLEGPDGDDCCSEGQHAVTECIILANLVIIIFYLHSGGSEVVSSLWASWPPRAPAGVGA